MGSLEQNAIYNFADPNGNNENQTEDCSLSVYIDEKFCIACFILLKLYNFGSEDIKADGVQTMCQGSSQH